MQSTTVRISDASRQLLRDLASQEGLSMQAVLDKALEAYRRQRFLESVNAAYAEVKQDPSAWQEFKQERELWDTTLTDGLDPDEPWTDEGDVHRTIPRTAT
ncbi:MAG: toxin-antitoxin system protein [Candidatus Tectomicrobia bacterium]|nr:toxin-antitoxin system protein [Candidatus Tectomicrobia bacterium]